MSDSFTTDRGTVFTKVSEEFKSFFLFEDLGKVDGVFFKHLIGMARFMGKDLALRPTTEKIQSGKDAADQRRAQKKAAAKAEYERICEETDGEYVAEMKDIVLDVLPVDEGNARAPRLIDINIQGFEASYNVKGYQAEPKEEAEDDTPDAEGWNV